MHISTKIQATIEMLDLFFSTHAPFDKIMAKFFRMNRKIGSSDRRQIADFSYCIFRSFEKLKFATQSCEKGRGVVIAFLKIEMKLSLEKITEIFSGKPFAPIKLIDSEKCFIQGLEKIRFPKYAQINCPSWLMPMMERAFSVDSLIDEVLALNQVASVDLRVNSLKSSKEEVRKMLIKTGFMVKECFYTANGLRIDKRIGRSHEIIARGLAEIQDEGSQLVAEACGVLPGNTVVDFCAGAGGKTLALAAIMQNKGRIFALDKLEERLEKAQMRVRRAGGSNVFCQQITGKWLKRHLECADVVLVDAPCSGTGTWRRNPDMRAKFSLLDLKELMNLQSEILSTACKLVKKNGRLVYATCSVLKEENEDQIAKFLEDHMNFKLKKVNLQKYSGDFLKLSPFKHQTDGFFAAIMQKTRNGASERI